MGARVGGFFFLCLFKGLHGANSLCILHLFN